MYVWRNIKTLSCNLFITVEKQFLYFWEDLNHMEGRFMWYEELLLRGKTLFIYVLEKMAQVNGDYKLQLKFKKSIFR
jgi:hypothetical protein